MISDPKHMLEVLYDAGKLACRHFIHADRRPLPPPSIKGNMINSGRFIMPLTNSKRIVFAFNGEICERVFYPGEVLVCPPLAWTREVWDLPHTMLSVVLRERYIRVLFIGHDGCPPEPHGPDVFYHTASPLSLAGVHTMQAIIHSSSGSSATAFNFRALLEIIVDAIKKDRHVKVSKESVTWRYVQDFIETNFRVGLLRQDIAAAVRIHPAHLSRLVRKNAGCGVNEYLTRMRMEYAVNLLADKSLTVGEIADLCGYQSASYFIRVFRRHFVDSPICYREKKLIE